MVIPIKLSDIIEAMDFQSEESSAYLNKQTGEIANVTEEEFQAAEDEDSLDDYPEWQIDNIKIAMEILDNEEDYIRLPSKYDIHEYEIMENFCHSIKDKKISEALCRAIKGKGAFGRFKNDIHKYELTEEWYEYKDNVLKEIAIEWCKKNQITYENNLK